MDVDLAIEVGAARVAARLEEKAARLPSLTEDAVEDLAADAELIFAAHTPSRSGRLARGVSAQSGPGLSAVVVARARNPESGYDYVGVSRWGHRVAFIYPKRARALRFTTRAGRVVFAKRVRGHKPATDWRDDAMPQVEERAEIVASRLGREITVRG